MSQHSGTLPDVLIADRGQCVGERQVLALEHRLLERPHRCGGQLAGEVVTVRFTHGTPHARDQRAEQHL
ncbi:MAG: hypothetical protein J0I70_00170, partial [Microbacterium sp.]|uniref:hypothetical protein n=1 Tax=Microbacterium sp. TaxID=51671 RepID=UPI001AD07F2B